MRGRTEIDPGLPGKTILQSNHGLFNAFFLGRVIIENLDIGQKHHRFRQFCGVH
jgi:hypothetical protein